MKKKTLVTLAASAALLWAGSAAYALSSLSSAFVSGTVNTVSDDDGEVLVDNVGGLSESPLTGVLGPTLDVGDFLVGAIGITSFPTSAVPANTVNEMTALFAFEVTGIPTLATGLPDALAFPNITGGNFAINTGATQSFTFAPVADFNAAISAAFPNLFGNLMIGGFTDVDGVSALPAGTIALIFEGNGTNDFLRSNPGDVDLDTIPNTLEDAALAAANGTARMTFGVGPGDFWNSAYAPRWVADALVEASLSPTGVAQVGAFSANLTILSQNLPGWTLGPDVTVTNGAFSGDLATLTGDTPWAVTSNADFQFNATYVPEPTTMVLLGSGLLGLAGIGRRRKNG